MKVTGLRIGNLIQNYDQVRVVGKIDLMGRTETYIPGGSSGLSDVECEPIPLNEKWLIGFGFTVLGSEWLKTGDFAIQLFDDGYHFTGLEGVKFGNPIIYVHQLQNLYFALMGEELELKVNDI